MMNLNHQCINSYYTVQGSHPHFAPRGAFKKKKVKKISNFESWVLLQKWEHSNWRNKLSFCFKGKLGRKKDHFILFDYFIVFKRIDNYVCELIF